MLLNSLYCFVFVSVAFINSLDKAAAAATFTWEKVGKGKKIWQILYFLLLFLFLFFSCSSSLPVTMASSPASSVPILREFVSYITSHHITSQQFYLSNSRTRNINAKRMLNILSLQTQERKNSPQSSYQWLYCNYSAAAAATVLYTVLQKKKNERDNETNAKAEKGKEIMCAN